jgi:transposase
MDHIGIDVHKNASQVCIRTETGQLIERRIRTDRDSFAKWLGQRDKARILVESSTESEWVARCLEELGHEVIVADPNFAPMYAQRSRKVKTDRRDARALCEACALGAYRPAHRSSEASRALRAQVAVREALVQTRTRHISLIRALLRQRGYRMRSGGGATFAERVGELELPEALRDQMAPLLEVMRSVNAQLKAADKALAEQAKTHEVAKRLCTAVGVGPVTAISFVATIDRVERFAHAKQVRAYLGLVPRELSSGEKQRRGHITKAGNRRMRALLVEASWLVLRSQRADTEALRTWANRIALRRGKRIAAVALARKLAGILFAMWRDGTDFGQTRTSAAHAA